MITIKHVDNGYEVEYDVYIVPASVNLTVNDLKLGNLVEGSADLILHRGKRVYNRKEDLIKYLEETL